MSPEVLQALKYFDPNVVCLAPPATTAAIASAEEAIGVRLPPSMRSFLLEHNGVSLGGGDLSLFGVPMLRQGGGSALIEETSHWRNCVQASRLFHERNALPIPTDLPVERLIIIGMKGTADCFALLPNVMDDSGEFAIALLDHETESILAIAASNYERLLWFWLDDLQRRLKPGGEYLPEEKIRKSQWPFNVEWMLQHDPRLQMFI